MEKKTIKMSSAQLKDGHLIGMIHEHHTLDVHPLRGAQVRTSGVIKREGNMVETKHTMYRVTSWAVIPDEES